MTFNTRREHQSYLQESHNVYSLSKAISKVDSKRQGQFKMQRPLNSRKKSEQMGKLRTRPAFQGKEECHGRQNHERRGWVQGPVGNDPLAWVLNQTYAGMSFSTAVDQCLLCGWLCPLCGYFPRPVLPLQTGSVQQTDNLFL